MHPAAIVGVTTPPQLRKSPETAKVHRAGTAFLDLATAGIISAPRVRRDRKRAVARVARWCVCVFMLWMTARLNQHVLLPCTSAPSRCKLVGL